MDLIYGIKDKPKFGKIVLFALQQLLAIMAATIAVPAIIGLNFLYNCMMTACKLVVHNYIIIRFASNCNFGNKLNLFFVEYKIRSGLPFSH